MDNEEIRIEPWGKAKMRTGTAFVAVFPHSDDFSIFAFALMRKLLDEGANGYFIRVTNDEMDSFDLTAGETMFRIEQETRNVAEFTGINQGFDFNYKNHYLQYTMMPEIRHRLITLFRFLKIDTVIAFDPWGHYEENPDHYLSGMAVEQACWMAGRQLDLPELTAMGIRPHFVKEKYYVARGPQASNLLVDAGTVYEQKLQAILLHATPVDNMFRQAQADGADFADPETFVKKVFLDSQPPLSGLKQYEKYRHIAG